MVSNDVLDYFFSKKLIKTFNFQNITLINLLIKTGI